MEENFRERLKSRQVLLGTIVSLAAPEIAELLSTCGFDWLFIDLEHGTLGFGDAQVLLMAASPQAACLVRVAANEEVWIKKSLDLGAEGIIVPQLRTAQDALRAVRFSRFPPEGERSVGIARAHGYGMHLQEYIDRANRNLILVLQIEHIQAVENLDAILEVEGVDALFIGPYDLSGSMGLPGKVNHPEVMAAMEKVRERCLAAGMPLGILCASAEDAIERILQGYSLILVGMDTILLGNSARGIVKTVREGMPKDH